MIKVSGETGANIASTISLVVGLVDKEHREVVESILTSMTNISYEVGVCEGLMKAKEMVDAIA